MNINSITLQEPSIINWPLNFFYPLSDEEMKSDCIFYNRLRIVNDEPVMLEYTYLPCKSLDKFLDNELVGNSLFATLRQRYQIEVNNVYQDIRAKSADAIVAKLLNTFTGAPILHIYRRYFTNMENFRIYSSLYCNTDKFFITNEFE
jgi:GntR family transcriptional regulator/GntR family frlABCD operon transcriptional regulator